MRWSSTVPREQEGSGMVMLVVVERKGGAENDAPVDRERELFSSLAASREKEERDLPAANTDLHTYSQP